MHIDNFIQCVDTDPEVSWHLWYYRLPMWAKTKFRHKFDKFSLSCIYKGERRFVSGCSKYGSIWLEGLYSAEGVLEKINLADCSHFRLEENLRGTG